MSNVVIPAAISAPAAPASASPSNLSAEMNATSVFEGASIVHYWPLPIHNNGIPGQTTAQVLARFKSDAVGQGYARVIILCGTNDIVQNTPNLITELTANLKAMGQIATAAGIQVVLSELPPETWNGVDINATVVAVNASIAQLARDQGYLLVDYFTPMFGHPEYFPDGIHPNAEGYSVMEAALAAVLN
jgi:lysophospholipase L1-like esterase